MCGGIEPQPVTNLNLGDYSCPKKIEFGQGRRGDWGGSKNMEVERRESKPVLPPIGWAMSYTRRSVPYVRDIRVILKKEKEDWKNTMQSSAGSRTRFKFHLHIIFIQSKVQDSEEDSAVKNFSEISVGKRRLEPRQSRAGSRTRFFHLHDSEDSAVKIDVVILFNTEFQLWEKRHSSSGGDGSESIWGQRIRNFKRAMYLERSVREKEGSTTPLLDGSNKKQIWTQLVERQESNLNHPPTDLERREEVETVYRVSDNRIQRTAPAVKDTALWHFRDFSTRRRRAEDSVHIVTQTVAKAFWDAARAARGHWKANGTPRSRHVS
ncbi:hypothetical protein K438DRAFT_2061708 [Mycena galopus ATCC 62051]|nr:hypothetical protein K438DRAFT_2061708 [Mycena galopus ATCC 62051]